jgi:effector-binding domain-containing protein
MQVEQITFGPQKYIGLKTTVTFDELKEKNTYESAYGKIMAYFQAINIQPVGAPVTIYFSWDEENKKTDIGIGFPVNDLDLVEDDDLELITVEESKATKTVHVGDYMKLKDTHAGMMEWLKENSLESGSYVIEEYQTSPDSEPDMEKWMTNIYYTIK